jgi:hypothetical protein
MMVYYVPYLTWTWAETTNHDVTDEVALGAVSFV